MRKASISLLTVMAIAILFTLTSMTMNTERETGAYLEVTLKIKEEDRMKAGAVYVKYKEPFLRKIEGATSKDLLLRGEDVQVLHGFETETEAQAYLTSELFTQDVVVELSPYLQGKPEVRIYARYK